MSAICVTQETLKAAKTVLQNVGVDASGAKTNGVLSRIRSMDI